MYLTNKTQKEKEKNSQYIILKINDKSFNIDHYAYTTLLILLKITNQHPDVQIRLCY